MVSWYMASLALQISQHPNISGATTCAIKSLPVICMGWERTPFHQLISPAQTESLISKSTQCQCRLGKLMAFSVVTRSTHAQSIARNPQSLLGSALKGEHRALGVLCRAAPCREENMFLWWGSAEGLTGTCVNALGALQMRDVATASRAPARLSVCKV